jgi:hypothetical protein
MDDPDFEIISDAVVRFEYSYLLRSTASSPATPSTVPYNAGTAGHTADDFYRDVVAVVVAIAILDPTSRVIVSDYSQLTSQTLFTDASDTEIAKHWTAAVAHPAFARSARIPQTAASSVRVYQRRFSLDTGAAE